MRTFTKGLRLSNRCTYLLQMCTHPRQMGTYLIQVCTCWGSIEGTLRSSSI